jgi:hypothetical protein
MKASDQKAEYDAKKKFLEDLKTLNKSDYEDMYRIIKVNSVEFTENSNGIFFDLTKINSTIFNQLEACVVHNRKQKILEKERSAEVEALLDANKVKA